MHRMPVGFAQLGIAVLILACADWRFDASRDERIAVLTADGYLSILRARDGALAGRIRISAPMPGVSPGRYLARDSGAEHLFAILPRGTSGGAEIAKISMDTRHVERRPLRDARVDFRSIAVGPRSRAAFVAGNGPRGLVLERVDIDSLGEQTVATIDARSDFEWRVYDTALDASEDTLYVSYHGMRTTGVDAFDTKGLRLHSCERLRPNHGCLPAHGSIISGSIGLIAATGHRFVYIYSHSMRDSVDLGLDTHLMQLAFDSADKRIIGIGSCLKGGGLDIYDVTRRAAGIAAVASRVEHPFHTTAPPCGERLAFLPRANAVIAARGNGSLPIVDLRTREVIHTVVLSGSALDVLVIEPTRH